ncbi:MAG: 16S rRNA (cytidine(1402)-2'-O)-methyltransferase [Defluviitoga tunisiensis]|jgi:16S rRNA (cytidine1402-2'-O)-methyltransferase|uniref:Ribosomal RNA small subunit methyltransferase I n=1 Tax=Defluviitoga tunisiensis TaxID=1006576 RepID=A0A0C7NI18_DEFTU|nr:16S rRNA (cytidine(1402)-2'-O)-methyltransferase [Defluviitoga tunisiensis]MDD3600482.1 16S rRNA (cytidine(1402)-2'-O)-methyltransferase [Defluviitoga tunisiensis]MDY0379123.1 16S rRNA (cytidine(1402)-2'-O)-methyltransferase [Defluviitoga tunisiensis]CEP77616.1 Ribosomal RNA small subunit methyltransferase I [Defluviitoga tunisiensis]HHV00640.1 16S rRNA (cytidine(1402)-2'-O)-methyltransferase [Defluviitoga tunisiensis]HOB55279.1 16S rRNA (cytidine(1402)-2'-O)-methyltransferase [Defluviitoga
MGKLYIVGTPIGNLEDITFRALKILEKADLIFTEDKRVTLKLINHYNLGKKELFTFNEANASKLIEKAITLIKSHEVTALVSDAGMPVISDPGSSLIEECWKEDIEIDIAPGPSAVTTALALSGFVASRFVFLGFLPRDKKLRRLLREINEKEIKSTIVFFESPNRIIKTLKEIKDHLGNVDLFVGREMTKLHQELFRGNVEEALAFFESKEIVKGELTVVISSTK